MKILFICGSLEAGRDGVGDYTRRLAEECAGQGHDCAVMALHDPYVQGAAKALPDNVRFIRLSAADPWAERLERAAHQLQRFAPDWVSWQLVAYGFHPRGFLPGALLQRAPELRGPRCHVMLHELWLGLEAGSSWRARAVGWLQRRGVVFLLDQLDPDCLHTSQAAYQEALRREDFTAGVLGLFGNVPIAESPAAPADALHRWLPASIETASTRPLVALTFGTLHPQWQPAATVEWLLATGRRLNRAPVLLVTGRAGAHAPGILDAFRRHDIPVVVTGELQADVVSTLLRSADLGIAAHPWELIGKSGAVAAMLEHGLPVLVPRDDWHLRGDYSLPPAAADPLLARLAGLDAFRTDRWLATRRGAASALPGIARHFLKSLTLTAERNPISSS